jgi:hypothetical protein
MGSVGTIAAISIGGCLNSGSSSGGTSSDSGSNSGTDNGDADTGEDNGFVDDLRSTYMTAINHNKNARTSLQQSIDEMNSDNLETADEHSDKAYTEFQNARGELLAASETGKDVWDVDSKEDLPEVHHKAENVNKAGHDATLILAEDLLNDEKTDSDTLDEIASNIEEGEYTMPSIEEFEQELP